MAVLLHEILDGIERRDVRCVALTGNTGLGEMGAITESGVELLAEVDDGEVIGPDFTAGAGKHLILCGGDGQPLPLWVICVDCRNGASRREDLPKLDSVCTPKE